MLLLGALLEHVGTARAVSLGRLASWVTAVEQRKEDQAWVEMPAIGAERFWLPEHLPVSRGGRREAWGVRPPKVNITCWLWHDTGASSDGRFGV